MKCTNHFIKYLGFILLLFLLPISYDCNQKYGK